MTSELSDPVELATVVGPAASRLIVVDFDGTLAPIVSRPEDAVASEGAVDALAALTMRTTVAVVSGRPVDDVRARLGGVAGLWIAGGHGAQLCRPDGGIEDLIDTELVAGTLHELEGVIRALVDDRPGWLVERKNTSIAVHHRLASPDDVDELLPRVTATLEAVRNEPPGFSVLTGKAVEELRPSSIDKGRALAVLAERTPGLHPLVIGDDITDEDAFQAADGMNGTSILVAEDDRPTLAEFRLADPATVVKFLHALATTR